MISVNFFQGRLANRLSSAQQTTTLNAEGRGKSESAREDPIFPSTKWNNSLDENINNGNPEIQATPTVVVQEHSEVTLSFSL